MALTTCQENATQQFLQFLLDKSKQEFALIGYSGCGKTFLIDHLIEEAKKQRKFIKALTDEFGELNFHLTATTNKASQHLEKVVGMSSQTIYSFLNLVVYNDYMSGKTKLRKTKDYVIHSDSLLIIDEASMIDKDLLQMIRDSTMNCKVLYVLDDRQLLSVFSTSCPVSDDMKDKAYLKTVVRQSNDSHIPTMGEKFRKAIDGGPFPKIETMGSDIICTNGPDFQDAVNAKFKGINDNPNFAKILAWTNERVMQYNSYIQEFLSGSTELQTGENLISNSVIKENGREDGKVIVKNEELVRVTQIEPESEMHTVMGNWITLNNQHRVFLPVNFSHVKNLMKMAKKEQDWGKFFKFQNFFADLRPIYASTVHKSQGSTYENVFVDLGDISKNNKREEVARLLYVAFTRASSRVFVYGSLPERYSN